MRWHVVSAVFWRNVKQYFSSVLGYLFLVVFVTVSAVLAFSPQFFADNLANLDQLSKWFPFLLLFIVPAITMNVWADEKKQGTDSILFTLPASDFEILLGKYLSVAAVFTIALLFSVTQLIALQQIGTPDWGVIAATYVGYWLCGLALLAIGMFASSLTESPTIAFVLGTIMCSIPVLIGQYFRGTIWLERLGISWNLQDFTEGLIPLANVIYFLTIIIFMLYLNLVVISRRHWSSREEGSLGTHYLARVCCLGVALLCCNYMASSWSSNDYTRVDLTAEKLFTLDQKTIETIEKAKENERPVTIQAFVSEEVPRKYVNAKKQFLGLLRQYDYYGGSYVNIRQVNVKPNSAQEKEAIKAGVVPIDDRSEIGGRTVEQRVFLGAHVSSTIDDSELPSVGKNTSMEYELTRLIASATDDSRQITLGILDTDLKFSCVSTGEEKLEFPDWWTFKTTNKRLKNHFKIKNIEQAEFPELVAKAIATETDETKKANSDEASDTDAEPNDETVDEVAEAADDDQAEKSKLDVDVLIVVDPSSLTQQCNDSLIEYIEQGRPVIILSDPMPFYLTHQFPILGLVNAPLMNRADPRFRLLSSVPLQPQGMPAPPKADAGRMTSLSESLGIRYKVGDVAWNLANPHPNFTLTWDEDELGNRWPDVYGPYDQMVNFVRNDGEDTAFNPDSPVTSGLRELLFIYPGFIKPKDKSDDGDLEFVELVSLGERSGKTDWTDIAFTPQQVMRGIDATGNVVEQVRPARSQLTRDLLLAPNPEAPNRIDTDSYTVAAHIKGKTVDGKQKRKTNVIFIADSDFVSELYFKQEAELDQPIDNFVFLLNAIEVLAGEGDFVELRNRRPILRTLTGFEKGISEFRKLRASETQKVEERIQKQRDTAEKELEEVGKKIQEDESMGMLQQAQLLSQSKSDALGRLNRKMDKLNDELEQEIQDLKSDEQQKTSALENRTRWLSVLLAPVPALLLGIFVLTIRSANERRTIDPRRRVRNAKTETKEGN